MTAGTGLTVEEVLVAVFTRYVGGHVGDVGIVVIVTVFHLTDVLFVEVRFKRRFN